jgi:outer membrane biosynthesis protein TonB
VNLHPVPRRASGPRRFLAFGVTLLGHAGILAALLIAGHRSTILKPPPIFYLTLDQPRPPPEPVKPPAIEPPPAAPAPKIVQLPPAPQKPAEKPKRPAAVPPPAADAGPPVHFFAPGAGAGTGTIASGLGTGDGGVRHAPTDYADKVKARILAHKVFPMAAQLLRQECVITYSVTIDRTGRMIAHHIDPCLYPMVNEAAETAILKGGPYEPPENGAETRVVYGSLPFHLEIQLPPVPARR